MGMKFRIKRYRNRKLYDMELKKYTSLAEIQEAIKRDITVEVFNFDGDDITKETMIKILSRVENLSTDDLFYLIKQG